MDIPETDSEDEMPPGWEERCTADGLVFYANHTSKTTQWTHPKTGKKKIVPSELPFGWERKVSEDGSIFIDHVNCKTTYADPRLAFAVEETVDLKDFRQKYDCRSTALQVLHGKDLTGQVAIVTGANSGIGYETGMSLAMHGCTVILACRTLAKAVASAITLLEEKNVNCIPMELDLASLDSVSHFVKDFKKRFRLLHILILNAGVFGIPFETTEDGLEHNLQVNYLSQFYLALLLQPLMSCTGSARVVFVSSESHRFSKMKDVYDIKERVFHPSRENYLPIEAYNDSKLLCIIGAFEFHRRFSDLGIKSFAVHPGNVVYTNLSRHWWVYRLIFAISRPFSKSVQQACASVIYCATDVSLENCSGVYINNCIPCRPSAASLDEVLGNAVFIRSMNVIENIKGKQAFYV